MDFKKHVKDIIAIKTSPHAIALGFALGTLIAILPTFGFGPLIALIVLFLFIKINKFSLFGAFIVWNPLITLPLYYLSYKFGNVLLGTAPVHEFEFSLLNAVHFLSFRFLIGNLLIALTFAIGSYFLVKALATKYQKKLKSLSMN